MPCYSPLRAWKGPLDPKTRKRRMVFRHQDAEVPTEYNLPCGRCIGCKLEYSRQWAVRCMHEAALHEDNCFITLTYEDRHLPASRGLVKPDVQKFLKRLKEHYGKYNIRDENGEIIKYGVRHYLCGEYGEKEGRPHYHAILFNHWFEDQKPWKQNEQGDMLHISDTLSRLWPHGFSSVGAATFKSAAYVARYVLKKVGTPRSTTRIHICPETGYVWPIPHEFVTMSRWPAIGSGWYRKYGEHMRDHGFVVMNEKKAKPPRLYDTLYECDDPDGARMMKLKRMVAVSRQPREEQMTHRLRVKEEVKRAQTSLLKRGE